jgi:hypothetical protein
VGNTGLLRAGNFTFAAHEGFRELTGFLRYLRRVVYGSSRLMESTGSNQAAKQLVADSLA